MNSATGLILLSSAFRSATAFTPLQPETAASSVPAFISATRFVGRTSELSAIIYGWDGEDDNDAQEDTTAAAAGGYSAVSSDLGYPTCSAAGTAIAESLSYDQDRIGSLARLAVAFSPPERQLTLKDVERVEVICVSENTIEIEAMVCEDGGCVSLSVPVKFPRDCSGSGEWLESCVRENLEHLDTEAESTVLIMEQNAKYDAVDLDELCQMNMKVDYPKWWVPPECNADLIQHCDDIKILLNGEDNEFQNEIKALARDGLYHAGEGDRYTVRKAKVAAVGPAGLCMKVAATSNVEVLGQDPNELIYLDVMYPFGGEPMTDVESLRAAVLGAIAAAEDSRPAHVYNDSQM